MESQVVRTAAWTFCALTMLASLVPVGSAQTSGVAYDLFLNCPGEDIYSTLPCPVRAMDADDAMGDPSLAVDPFQPDNLILASLHGSGDSNGPSVKSRAGQVFTTFTSRDSGRGWTDNPYYPPSDVSPNAYGEHTGITIDPYGHVYVGSLYAVPTSSGGESGSGTFDYVIAAQKFSSLINVDEEQEGSYNAEYLDPVYLGNKISQMWFLFNPQRDHMTMVWTEQLQGGARAVNETSGNGTNQSGNQTLDLPAPLPDVPLPAPTTVATTATPSLAPAVRTSVGTLEETATMKAILASETSESSETGGGSSTPARSESPTPRPVAAPPSDNVVRTSSDSFPADYVTYVRDDPSLLMADEAEDVDNDPDTPKSVIGVAWTNTSMSSGYHYQRLKWVIGPCAYSTNPVLSEGWLYVGCVADTEQGPFPWNDKTEDGDIEMFRMDPDGGKPQYIGQAPIRGEHPKLGVRSDGRIALTDASASEDGRLQFQVAFGEYDTETKKVEWSSSKDMSRSVARIDPSVAVVEAQIQDMVYREYSGVLHIILKQVVEPTGAGATTLQTAVGPKIWKSLIALDENEGYLTRIELDVGNILNRTDPLLLQAEEMVYNDLTDDFMFLPPAPHSFQGKPLGDTYQREFFAIADYGTILFAEVMEITDLRGPGQPPPGPPPPPTPAPAASSALSQALAPAAGLTVAGLVAANFFSNKRKDVAVVRDSGKKRRRN